MKYVIVKKGTMELAIFLPDQVQHCEAVNRQKCEAVAAGFLRERDGRAFCDGESVSLNLASRGDQDLRVIEFTLGLMGDQMARGGAARSSGFSFIGGVGAKERSI
jgi:hypothetical protein